MAHACSYDVSCLPSAAGQSNEAESGVDNERAELDEAAAWVSEHPESVQKHVRQQQRSRRAREDAAAAASAPSTRSTRSRTAAAASTSASASSSAGRKRSASPSAGLVVTNSDLDALMGPTEAAIEERRQAVNKEKKKKATTAKGPTDTETTKKGRKGK